MKAIIGLALVLALADQAVAQRPSNEPLPEIHPNDRTVPSVQQRLDEIRRHNDVRDLPQQNSLESLQQQQRNSAPPVGPLTPPERRNVPERSPTSRPGEWPGYQPGHLPRQ